MTSDDFLFENGYEIEDDSLSLAPPVIALTISLFLYALKNRASLIHIGHYEGKARTAYRVEGILVDGPQVPDDLFHVVVARLKIMASIDVAERRSPQAGEIRIIHQKRIYRCPIQVRPAAEDMPFVDIRILNDALPLQNLQKLEFTPSNLEHLLRWIANPSGIVLVSGPSGSGKTSILYGCLNELRRAGKRIVTLEDCPMVTFDDVRQLEMPYAVGSDIVGAARKAFRFESDVLIIDAIRDRTTAELALQAAEAGHLVLAALHTHDAPAAAWRLLHLGLDPPRTAARLLGSVSTRTLRRICPHCREEVAPSDWIRELLDISSESRFYRGAGCDRCDRTGYRGRIGAQEVFTMTEAIRPLLASSPSAVDLCHAAKRSGTIPLREDAFRKATQGLTTIGEIQRAFGDYEEDEGPLKKQ